MPPAPAESSLVRIGKGVLTRHASEVDEVVERSRIRDRRGAKDRPLVEIVRVHDFLERPAQIPHEERRGACDAR